MWYTHTHTRRESETQQQLISLQTFSCWREMKRVQAVCNIYLSFPHWNGQHGGPSHYHETAVNKNSKIKQSVPSLPAQSAHLLPCYFHATPQLGWKKPKTAHTPTQGCVGFLHCSVYTNAPGKHAGKDSTWSVFHSGVYWRKDNLSLSCNWNEGRGTI